MIRWKHFLWALIPLVGLAVSCAPVGDVKRPEIPTSPFEPPPSIEKIAQSESVPRGVKDRIEAALEHVKSRELLTTHSFWTVIHGILGNGLDASLRDPVTGQKVVAIDYICQGGHIRGLEFIPLETGVDVKIGPVFDGQGHQDQFIAEITQLGFSKDHKFTINGKEYVFEDLLRHAKVRARVDSDQELSWTLVSLSHYYGTDFRWTNMHGHDLHFEDLVRYEVNQPIATAACGGTHRLFGLSFAYYLHLRNGGKKTSVWKEVEDKLNLYKENARKFQNPDGSFSTKYVSGPENVPDLDRRIGSTGHVLEWLSLHMTTEELRQPWVQEAASALSVMILGGQGRLLDAGSLYHAAHGLHLYHDRVFGEGGSSTRKILPFPD